VDEGLDRDLVDEKCRFMLRGINVGRKDYLEHLLFVYDVLLFIFY